VVAKAESFAVSSLLSAASLHAAAAHARFPSADYDCRRRLKREVALHIYIYSKAAPYRRTISHMKYFSIKYDINLLGLLVHFLRFRLNARLLIARRGHGGGARKNDEREEERPALAMESGGKNPLLTRHHIF
jgi:hypothetical protein